MFMCGRFVLVDTIKVIKAEFNVSFDGVIEPNYNISVGQHSLVITDDKPHQLQQFQFGLTPFWAKKQMYLFNARADFKTGLSQTHPVSTMLGDCFSFH